MTTDWRRWTFAPPFGTPQRRWRAGSVSPSTPPPWTSPNWPRARRAGLEITARQERYRFLARLARTRDADAIVTGHTMDDQAETVLLHLIRGAGVDGLAGMRPRSAVPVADAIAAAPLIRPLLALRRRETEALCRAFGVTPANDPANDQPDLLRNAIRHDLVPRLEALNPRAVEMLAALAGSAAADRDLLEQLTTEAVPRVTLEAETGAPAVIVSRRALLREAAGAAGPRAAAAGRVRGRRDALARGARSRCWALCSREEGGWNVAPVPWRKREAIGSISPYVKDESWAVEVG